MVHMESHWREHHPDIAISQDTPPVLDLSANLRHPFEQMNLICFPPIILQHSIPSPQSECTATCSPQRAIDSLIAGDSRQRLVTEDEEAIPIEEDESNTASPPMSTDDRPSFYSRATVSRTCKECQVDHFDAAEHCATRHARSFPFRCGDDQCGESFSSIIRFIKHAAVLHGKQPNNSSTISLIVNKTRLKTLEASIAHCFGHLELDDIDL
uniref:C2H2-type domain-containing protein n=1 Tax=Plectus sambesii TaxID=2011161 RepID=A0A914XD79_9BILA